MQIKDYYLDLTQITAAWSPACSWFFQDVPTVVRGLFEGSWMLKLQKKVNVDRIHIMETIILQKRPIMKDHPT